MKSIDKIGIALTVVLTFVTISGRATYDEKVIREKAHNSPRSAAECAPATRVEYLKFNNVNALIETGGSMWQDRPNSAPAYEVPQNSGKTAIYAGALWMGGVDPAGNLKIAAVDYRTGTNDFWTGPLDKGAEITPDVCQQYDRFFHITRQEVIDYIDYWNCNKNPTPPDGCADRDFSAYQIPRVILDWPAHGDESRGQDFYLAPFFDRNADGLYNPDDGDYPYYDLTGEIDCRAVRDIRLFGDDTYWWVFNDKGNIHTETNGQSIGMEIRAQAFAFATNDEVNDMTFYNYELINRSTFTLQETYFGQWVDADLGCADDDYVGCDVGRGLGYAYNGDQFDEDCRGAIGYGNLPAAIGVDFFEGPYQDNDGINNKVGIGPGEALNGIGYLDESLLPELQDSIVDNERYGMRRFVYYDRGTDALRGDPVTALQFYNYLRSIWKDGAKMVYGGNGHPTNPNATNIEADFMFPGESDPLNWGTRGIDPGGLWTEVTAGNPPFDRRFIQSAGPFTLRPGAVNDITVGVVFAQATSGDNTASVDKMILADSKAQALFDNCFDVLDGPDAPDLSGVELNKEIILLISNRQGVSNNFKVFPGDYEEEDPFIITPEGESPYDNKYRFQGYLIYQVADQSVSVSDLEDLDKARLAFQCDIKDDVTDLINYEFDESLNASVPKHKVRNAANAGIVNSFRVTNDLFSETDPRLVNFKTYYFIAISYGYNNFKDYIQDEPLNLDGQKLPFISSRKSTTGGITSVAFTPHPQEPKYGGMKLQSQYGDQPEITRLEGQGNGGTALAFTPETLQELLDNSTSPTMNQPTYQSGAGPINVKVIDPTQVVDGLFKLQMFENEDGDLEWKLWREGGSPSDLDDTIYSQNPLSIQNEQIIQDWGISLTVTNVDEPNALITNQVEPDPNYDNGFIDAYLTYADSSKAWLTGVQDLAGTLNQNWLRSGTSFTAEAPDPDPTHPEFYDSYSTSIPNPNVPNEFLQIALDPFEFYSSPINGTWGPYRLCAATRQEDQAFVRHAPAHGQFLNFTSLQNLQSVDIVITDNKDLWTRCPVIELQDESSLAIGGAVKGSLRRSPSVDKDGAEDGSGTGMGWFPGYAINMETGERLNMAFGEDSWLGAENGSDMKWNPTSTFESGLDPNSPSGREVKWGGKHYVYVFGNTKYFPVSVTKSMPSYDEGFTLYQYLLNGGTTDVDFSQTYASCMWVGIPMVEQGRLLMETDVTVSLRVQKPYALYESNLGENNGFPMYEWNMNTLKTTKNVNSIATDALNMIRVVPNPYYAFAEHYEQSQLDNFVKITNLPQRCTVSIYNVSGTLVRRYNKSDPTTEIKWDLVNQSNVPIAGGVYLIHVDAPGIGETIVKWFGVLRPVDLRGF